MASFSFVYPDYESLGVGYLMASCKAAGHDVRFVYFDAEDVYISRKADTDYAALADTILADEPDVVAFSCVSDNYAYQLRCAAEIKLRRPSSITLFGGVHPSAVPLKVLARSEVDCVAVGEADESLPQFLELCESPAGFSLPDDPVGGMVFESGGELRDGSSLYTPPEDLDTLPFPDKRPFLEVLDDARTEYRIVSSRGCPFQCSYCFNSFFHEFRGAKRLRRRSAENVLAELEWAKREFSPKYVIFLDDCFTASKRWLTAFLEQYRNRIRLPFACVTHAGSIDGEVASLLRQAGCVNVQMGIQSLSESLCREVLDRKTSNQVIIEALGHLKKAGIMVQVDHMLGIPGDTVRDQEQAVLFYNEHRPDLISIFWLTYFPKTAIIEKAVARGVMTRDDVARLEDGQRLRESSYLNGGDSDDPGLYRGLSLLMNWLPLLPKPVVRMLVKSRAYRLLATDNYYLNTALPRVIRSLVNPRDFRGRSHVRRFVGKHLPSLARR